MLRGSKTDYMTWARQVPKDHRLVIWSIRKLQRRSSHRLSYMLPTSLSNLRWVQSHPYLETIRKTRSMNRSKRSIRSRLQQNHWILAVQEARWLPGQRMPPTWTRDWSRCGRRLPSQTLSMTSAWGRARPRWTSPLSSASMVEPVLTQPGSVSLTCSRRSARASHPT